MIKLAFTLLTAASLVAHADHHPAPSSIAELEAAGFTALFNGKDLSGWRKTGGTGEYEVKDGAIRGFGQKIKGNTFLRTEDEFGDFILTFKFKFLDKSGNSGCMFRAFHKDGQPDGRVTGYQCEHDNWKQPQRGFTAGIYDEARRGWLSPAKNADQKLKDQLTGQSERIFKWDDWNTIVIKCQGNHLQTWLNGEPRADFTDTHPEHTTLKGFIGLQVHGGKSADILWKDLYLKKL
ncbi:MAG: DUF1080 domain-containing protein [Verrucomicrobiota bacterium]